MFKKFLILSILLVSFNKILPENFPVFDNIYIKRGKDQILYIGGNESSKNKLYIARQASFSMNQLAIFCKIDQYELDENPFKKEQLVNFFSNMDFEKSNICVVP